MVAQVFLELCIPHINKFDLSKVRVFCIPNGRFLLHLCRQGSLGILVGVLMPHLLAIWR